MRWVRHFAVILILSMGCHSSLVKLDKRRSQKSDLEENQLDEASTNFFTSDLGSYESDYRNFFEGFSYFPEFKEIFRVSKTTTPQPPFQFPDYVLDAFPDQISGNSPKRGVTALSGGRRPSRPRPASSGTRTKVTKQNQSEPKDKPRSFKSKLPSRNYPKIFRFNPERVNLAEFDTEKKLNENYLTLAKGDELDFDKVKRNKFFILHGGIFELERRLHLINSHSSEGPKSDQSESIQDDLY